MSGKTFNTPSTGPELQGSRDRQVCAWNGCRSTACSAATNTPRTTNPNDHMVVVRMVAPAMKLLKAVRVAWREVLWGLEGEAPRIGAM